MKTVDGGKSANITIRCTARLRDKIEKFREMYYFETPMNVMLGQLIDWQIDAETQKRKGTSPGHSGAVKEA